MLKAFLFVFALAATAAAADLKVTVVHGEQAAKLEKFAAAELAAQLKSLFAAETSIQTTVPQDESAVILLGNPESNPAMTPLHADAWPKKLGAQGHCLKSAALAGRPVLIIGGTTPAATLWGVYEFGYRNGLRYLLNGDVPPIEKPAFHLDGYDVKLEPTVSIRAWDGFIGDELGAEGWRIEDHQRLMRQLAKNKFTHYVVPAKITSFEPILVDGDSGGRTAFKGVKEFAASPGGGLREAIQASAEELGLDTAAPEEAGPLTLGAPTRSTLPQFSLRKLETDFNAHRKTPGFVAKVVMPGDLNAAVHYLSRAAVADQAPAEKVFAEFVTPICGEGVAERLIMGFDLVEKAAKLIATNDPRVTAPEAKVLLRELESKEPPPAWWVEVKTCYTQAMNEMYRGNTRARGGARPYILYHAKRLEFAMQYFTALEALRRAGNARSAKDAEAEAAALEQAVEALYNGLNAFGEVARDRSDLGAIALLNAEGYRPLLKVLDGSGE